MSPNRNVPKGREVLKAAGTSVDSRSTTLQMPRLHQRMSHTNPDTTAASILAYHIPGIDVLRGIAILLVVLFHGMAYSAPDLRWRQEVVTQLYNLTAWGRTGVNLFFVLSGFLISGILDDTVHQTNYYRRFYIRRALRILPAYIAILLAAWAAGVITGNYLVVCLFFLANMPGAFLRPGYLAYGPLWSLAVEEQFYLLWPLLYRVVRRRGILWISVGLMVLCPILRALAFTGILFIGEPLSKTWMVADNLAAGAIIAILVRSHRITLKRLAAIAWCQCAIGTFGLALLVGMHRMGFKDPLRNSIGVSCITLLCSSVLIMMLVRYRMRGVPRAVRWLMFFGDISYGLYLIHPLVLKMYDRVEGPDYQHQAPALMVRFVLANGIAILIAVLSRRFFEDPILRLKTMIAAAR